jgi:hypothetical protein
LKDFVFIKPWFYRNQPSTGGCMADSWRKGVEGEGEGVVYAYEAYEVSKKAKNCAVFCFSGFFF